jgi:hypothetical protein
VTRHRRDGQPGEQRQRRAPGQRHMPPMRAHACIAPVCVIIGASAGGPRPSARRAPGVPLPRRGSRPG